MSKDNNQSYIDVNGEKYIKVDALNAKSAATAKLKEYVESLNIKNATSEEIEHLLEIARIL
ncbi:hypothetical protein [Erysipelothrix anatis]|uniref:hypothetical protein n=1 Tax=Erysipelothrix anatis TaxID=2683713 RepID=UPI001359460D|nr:hypothetical protein [Erysipelothrix anatis]